MPTENLTTRRYRQRRAHSALADIGKELKRAMMPRRPGLMHCTLLAEPFDDPAWIFESKLDGLRVVCRFAGKHLRLLSRNYKPQEFQFPDIRAALHRSLCHPVILDGEIVCLDERGHSSLRILQQQFHLQDATLVEERMRRYPAYLYLFDLLYVDRYDVTGLPLEKRKYLLRDAVQWTDRIRWTEYRPEKGTALLKQICDRGGEGIIGKHLQSAYVPERNRDWVKVKCVGQQEFVIEGRQYVAGSIQEEAKFQQDAGASTSQRQAASPPHLRGAGTSCLSPTLRFSLAGRGRPEELGRSQGAKPGPLRQTLGRPGGGSSPRVR